MNTRRLALFVQTVVDALQHRLGHDCCADNHSLMSGRLALIPKVSLAFQVTAITS